MVALMLRFLALGFLLLAVCVARADDTLLLVQKQLKADGYYRGPLDGQGGSQTAAAIRRYQLAKDLRVTGALNEQTLQSLRIQPGKPSGQPTPAKPAATPVPAYVALAEIFKGGPYISAPPETQIATIRQAQKNLKTLGFYGGPANGSPTADFIASLKAWQKDAGFRPTGRFDETTLKGLSLVPD